MQINCKKNWIKGFSCIYFREDKHGNEQGTSLEWRTLSPIEWQPSDERRAIIDRHKGRSWHRETQNAEIWWQDPDSWSGTQPCRGCRYVDCLVILTVNFSEKFHVDKTFSDLKVLGKTRLPSQSFEFHKSMYIFFV